MLYRAGYAQHTLSLLYICLEILRHSHKQHEQQASLQDVSGLLAAVSTSTFKVTFFWHLKCIGSLLWNGTKVKGYTAMPWKQIKESQKFRFWLHIAGNQVYKGWDKFWLKFIGHIHHKYIKPVINHSLFSIRGSTELSETVADTCSKQWSN